MPSKSKSKSNKSKFTKLEPTWFETAAPPGVIAVNELTFIRDDARLRKNLFDFEVSKPKEFFPQEQFWDHLNLVKAFILGKFSFCFQ